MTFSDLEINKRVEVINRIYDETGIIQQVIEKDWWVTMTLRALFETSCANFLVFKGGTSLSKGWGLIERFSEDIDVAISRDFFGITNVSSKNQRDKLRKLSSKYVQEKLMLDLEEKLKNAGISGFMLEVEPTESSDTDPRVLYVHYKTLFPENAYLLAHVKIEISCRSLREPFEPLKMRSMIAENYPDQPFADKSFTANTVSPKRTFLEKAFLLHEALQRGRTKITRMTRHLYDLHKLMDTKFAEDALADTDLYKKNYCSAPFCDDTRKRC
ncbi:MAG: nucleotidyl transferase AbiEii/AbiGii toxin family protein [Prevotellaceae bacterium]|jgi:hypothetical protein|nr:nucleotidyl transferase AbiEii/AbiGii toxin family protein [Prevotellaceae bacterium]